MIIREFIILHCTKLPHIFCIYVPLDLHSITSFFSLYFLIHVSYKLLHFLSSNVITQGIILFISIAINCWSYFRYICLTYFKLWGENEKEKNKYCSSNPIVSFFIFPSSYTQVIISVYFMFYFNVMFHFKNIISFSSFALTRTFLSALVLSVYTKFDRKVMRYCSWSTAYVTIDQCEF